MAVESDRDWLWFPRADRDGGIIDAGAGVPDGAYTEDAVVTDRGDAADGDGEGLSAGERLVAEVVVRVDRERAQLAHDRRREPRAGDVSRFPPNSHEAGGVKWGARVSGERGRGARGPRTLYTANRL